MRYRAEQARLRAASDAQKLAYAARFYSWIRPLLRPDRIGVLRRGWLLAEKAEETSSSYAQATIIDRLYVTTNGEIIGNVGRFTVDDIKRQIALYVNRTREAWPAKR
jgi:hypothetical protein